MSSLIHSIFSKKPSKTRKSRNDKTNMPYRSKDEMSPENSPPPSKSVKFRRTKNNNQEEYQNVNRNHNQKWMPSRSCPGERPSSEYGSADPSPTHNVVAFNESSADSTDCESSDSDTETIMAEYYEKKYRDQIKKLRKECKRYHKDAMFYYRFYKEYEKMLHKYEMVKHEAYQLRTQLMATLRERELSHIVNQSFEAVSIGQRGAPEELCSSDVLSDGNVASQSTASTIAMDDMDEVKIFRNDDDQDDFMEVPRSLNTTMVVNTLHDQYVDMDGIPIADDGYSTLNKEIPNTTNGEGPSTRGLSLSLSDSELYKPEHSEDSALKLHDLRRDSRRYARNDQLDYSSTCTSDEDNMRVISKQLRRRGDCVLYKGRRTDIVSAGQRIYRRFGTSERQALAQFEYLQDMSTDISGFLTSADPSPSYK